MLNNEKGYALVTTIGILALLTIIGVSSLQISMTEQKISFNSYIYEKNFYAAESGIAIAPIWLKENLSESDYMNVDYLGEFDMSIGTGNHFFAKINHTTGIDPVDGVEKVVLYGDENGDYLNEINFTTGMPLEIVNSRGTHIRGGRSNIKATFKYEYIFVMPDAALRVNENVNGNGVAGSIIGEDATGDCEDVPDIMYDIAGGTIDYSGDMGDAPVISESGGMYPYPIMRDNLFRRATQVLTPANGKVDPSAITTSESDPGVVFITGDTKITNLTGYGILVVDGNYDCAGNLDWHGLIIVGGDLVLSGGGSKVIYGSVVAMGNAVAINGSVDIQYDCSVLSDLQDEYSKYRMTSWNDMI